MQKMRKPYQRSSTFFFDLYVASLDCAFFFVYLLRGLDVGCLGLARFITFFFGIN